MSTIIVTTEPSPNGNASSGIDGIVFVFTAIVSITVGVIVLTLLIILAVYCCQRRKRKQASSGQTMVTITRQPHQHVDRPRNTEHLYAEAVEPSAPPFDDAIDGGYTSVPPSPQSQVADDVGYTNVPPPYPGV